VSSYDPAIAGAMTKTKCLPTYLVLDTSHSMKAHEKDLNEALRELHRTVKASPRVGDFAHLSIISFNTDPHLVLELRDIGDVEALPMLGCSGTTDNGKAFDLVRAQIEADRPGLLATGRPILRPTVFIMTDGAPMDDEKAWTAAFARLTDPAWTWHPHVVSYGFGTTSADTLKRIQTAAAFQAVPGISQSEALGSLFVNLLNTLVSSADGQTLRIPANQPGFIELNEERMH
jgi:uncharacterized protein YegL